MAQHRRRPQPVVRIAKCKTCGNSTLLATRCPGCRFDTTVRKFSDEYGEMQRRVHDSLETVLSRKTRSTLARETAILAAMVNDVGALNRWTRVLVEMARRGDGTVHPKVARALEELSESSSANIAELNEMHRKLRRVFIRPVPSSQDGDRQTEPSKRRRRRR